MRQITKIVQEIGNGGHIYLPKEMVGQKVIVKLVHKSIEEIEEDILRRIRPYLKHIMGVYIYGSYARGEQTPESDIDILVITDGKIKIKEEGYEILSVSLEELEKTLRYNAVLILPILKEARVVLNAELISRYRDAKLDYNNTKWYIETTETSLNLAEDWIKDRDMRSIPNIVYPLIMRLRGLYMIESMINNKKYTNKEIDEYLAKEGLSPDTINEFNNIYRCQRDEKRISRHSLDYSDVTRLYNIVRVYYRQVRLLWAKQK